MGVENVSKHEHESSPLPPSLHLLLHEWRIHAIARPRLASSFACSHVNVHCRLLVASPIAPRGCALPCTHTGPQVASCMATFVHPPSPSFVRPLHGHEDTSRACTISHLRHHVCLSPRSTSTTSPASAKRGVDVGHFHRHAETSAWRVGA